MTDFEKAIAETSGAGRELIGIFRDILNVYIEPKKRIRMAEAEAQAIKIIRGAELQADQKEFFQRIGMRFLQEQFNKQENLESIGAGAIPLLEAGARPREIEKSWLFRFSSCAEFASEEGLRKLWSKILASEANQPKTISFRTLELVKLLSQDDAKLIEKISEFIFEGDTEGVLIKCSANTNDVIKEIGLAFLQIKHLENIGILNPDPTVILTYKPKETHILRYGNESYSFVNVKDSPINIGVILLSLEGFEILKILSKNRSGSYFNCLTSYLEKVGIKVEKISVLKLN
jgi:Protein of unknown function (DUF2806)